MNAGIILVAVYWAIFTVKRHFTPRLTAAIKANTYDLNRNDPEAKRAAQRKRGPLTAAKWALRATGWLENIVIALVMAWLVFIVGAVLPGTVVVFG